MGRFYVPMRLQIVLLHRPPNVLRCRMAFASRAVSWAKSTRGQRVCALVFAILFCVSLTQPAMHWHGSTSTRGLTFLFWGFFGVPVYWGWLANPFALWCASMLWKGVKTRLGSTTVAVLSLLALVLAALSVTNLNHGLPVEFGYGSRPPTSIGAGFWFWLGAITVLAVGSLAQSVGRDEPRTQAE